MRLRSTTLILTVVFVGLTVTVTAAEVTPAPRAFEPKPFVPDRLIVRFEPMSQESARRTRESLPNVKALNSLLPASPLRSADPREDGPHQIYVAELVPGTDVLASFRQRIVKEALHELGHTFNLRHCPDQTCIMHYCRSIRDVDRKSEQFCRYCKVLLEDEIKRLA